MTSHLIVGLIKNDIWTYVINDLNGELIAKSSYENKLQKTSQEKIRTEKVINRKGDRFLVKLK